MREKEVGAAAGWIAQHLPLPRRAPRPDGQTAGRNQGDRLTIAIDELAIDTLTGGDSIKKHVGN